MKKFKTKLVAGILAGLLATNIYATDTTITTPDPAENITQAVEITTENNGVVEEIEVAIQSFSEEGMSNLYSKFRRSEKRKWLKLINENNYFETEEQLQYQISGIYEIAENQYYLLGWSTTADEKLRLAEYWSEEKQAMYMPQDIFQLVLTKEDDQYFATHTIYPSENILSADEVSTYKKEQTLESNVSIEYSKVRKFDGLDEYVDYLDQAIAQIEENEINDNAKGEVTQYVQYAIEDLTSNDVVAEENVIDISQDLLVQMEGTMQSAKDKFDELLDEKEISFNKSLNTVLRIQTQELSFKKPIYIQLPETIGDLGEMTGLRILLDKESYIYIERADLEILAGLKIKIERLKDKSTYEITFLTPEDEVIPQLEAFITFAFPAKDELSTVVVDYGQESQNWGGQYDASSGTIAFGTKYTGAYQVVDNYIKIKDIDRLPKSQQSAIKFMVSKGYLNLEDEYFYPDNTFTRYEFAEALVKMFFALDTSLTTTLKDVPEDSIYYPYIASGETFDIIKGYADETFRGDLKIPVEQVLSLCARTIADKKGYLYPEQTDEYIQFADKEAISKWAVNDIALAVQSGLVTSGGTLLPQEEITKAESAEILYKLFMLLHETSPEQVIEFTTTQKTYSVIGVLLVALLAFWLIRRFIRRNKVIITMILCTAAIIATLLIVFKN